MSGGGSKTSSTQAEIPKELKPYVTGSQGILPEAKDLYQAGGFGQIAKPGKTTVAGEAAGTSAAQNIQKNILPQSQALFGAMQNQQQLSGSEQLSNAMRAATADLRTGYERSTIPGIQDAAAASGTYGGSRQGIAEGLARSDLERNILNTNASMQYQAAADDAARRMQGQGMAAQFMPSLLSAQTAPMNIYGAVGAQQDAYKQALLNQDMTNMSNYAALMRQFIPGTSQTTMQSGGSKMGSAAGGALSGAAAGATVAGPWGAAAGGLIGGLGGYMSA